MIDLEAPEQVILVAKLLVYAARDNEFVSQRRGRGEERAVQPAEGSNPGSTTPLQKEFAGCTTALAAPGAFAQSPKICLYIASSAG